MTGLLTRLRRRWGRTFGDQFGRGGVVSAQTGLGTALDHGESLHMTPSRWEWRSPLEILYVQSWAARNYITIPVQDMFIRWRRWISEDDEDAIETMEAVEAEFRVKQRLWQAMCGARAFGTSMVVIMTREAPPEAPLVVERVREGDLAALHVWDRYDATVFSVDDDVMSPNFGRPLYYDFYPSIRTRTEYLRVHHSRVLRLDGLTPLTDSGFWNYSTHDWGVSLFTPVIKSILQDQALAAAITHLAQEASIPVLGVENLSEMAGRSDAVPGETTIEQLLGTINRAKSIFRTMAIDKNTNQFERVAVAFGGLADLMDRFYARLAAAAQIPETRFLGRSPAGMSATGESDMRNYVMMLEAARAQMLEHPLATLDGVMARSAGLPEAPEWEWMSLLELSEQDQANMALVRVQALSQALADSAIDEDEYRRQLDGTPVFGPLPGEAPEPDPEPVPMPDGPPQDDIPEEDPEEDPEDDSG